MRRSSAWKWRLKPQEEPGSPNHEEISPVEKGGNEFQGKSLDPQNWEGQPLYNQDKDESNPPWVRVTSPNPEPPPDPIHPGQNSHLGAARPGFRDTNPGKSPKGSRSSCWAPPGCATLSPVPSPWQQVRSRAQEFAGSTDNEAPDLFLMALFTGREVSRSQNLSLLIKNKQITTGARRENIWKPSGFDLIDPGNKPGIVRLEQRL